jgi:MFS family permease
LLLAVGTAVDRHRTRKRLAAFVAVAVVSITFSLTALFVAAAVFGGLVLVAALDRAWRWAAEVVVAGVAVAVLMGAYLAAVVLPHLHTALNHYWAPYYLRGSLSFMAHVSWRRLGRLEHALAIPSPVFVAFFIAGIVALYWLRARALAFAVPGLWVEMALMGRLSKYPFLDERTSHFLLITSLVVVAIGAVATVFAIGTMLARVNRIVAWVSCGALALVLASLFASGVGPYLYDLHIPHEDLRAQTEYIAAHRHAGDVILVDYTASFGLAYYWPHPRLEFRSNQTGQAFEVHVEGIRAVYVKERTAGGALSGLERAVRMWRAAPAGSRLFIVRTHVDIFDVKNWQAAFDRLHLRPKPVPVGIEQPLVLTKR